MSAPASSKLNPQQPKSTSKTIAQFHRSIQSRAGLDAQLYVAGESARLAAVLADSFSQSLHHGSPVPAWLQGRLLSKTAVHKKRLPSSLVSTVSTASSRLQILSALLEEWQILNRLLGLLDVWAELRELVAETLERERPMGRHDKINVALRAATQIALGFYFIGENLSYLASRGLFKWSAKTRDDLTYFANRSWTASIICELSRLVLERREKQTQATKRLETSQKNEADVIDDKQELTEEWRRAWRDDFLSNLFWLPVTSHLSVRGGLLPEAVASTFAVCAVIIPARNLWRQSD